MIKTGVGYLITLMNTCVVFRIFDKDEDGKLSVAELKKVVSTLGDRITGRYDTCYIQVMAKVLVFPDHNHPPY